MARSTIGGQPCPSNVSDAELLERFVACQDETAFAALVVRHGPMVFGVCRRTLHHAQDAEDAFQATFLILVRKASAIGRRELLANWLYGVALRVAQRARLSAARRQAHETADMERIAETARQPAESADLAETIETEVQRLPAKYRVPVVLYYLQGRTSEEVASELRCPVGTIKTRLSRAREMLRKQLTRRGLALSTAALSTALLAETVSAALPASLLDLTIKAATCFAAGDAAAGGFVSARAVALTKGVLHTMFVTKMKTLAAFVLVFVMAVGGVGAFAYHLRATEAEAKKTDKENIQGTWKVVSGKSNGNRDDAEKILKRMEIVITADKFTVHVGDKSMEATYKIDPETKPKTIDQVYILPEGGDKRMESLGIYKLEGDTLTICSSNPKKERPKEFESTKGNGATLIVLKRVKK